MLLQCSVYFQCAFAAPQVQIIAQNIDEVPRPRDNGRQVNSYLGTGLFELLDGGDKKTVFILSIEHVISDLLRQPDSYSQAMGLSNAVALVGELAPSAPGDACGSADMVNAYASGNQGAIRQAVSNYVSVINTNIDTIAKLAVNPSSLRYAVGPSGNCPGGGRSYQFEAAWDRILESSNPYQIGLVNEEYCSARRLYTANSVQSNNVGAAISASSTAPITQVFAQSIGPVSNFLRAAISGQNVQGAAQAAKSAISNAARYI